MRRSIIHTRQRNILIILNSRQSYCTGTELARRLDVTPRTIRSDIIYLNQILAQYHIAITSVRGRGYRLSPRGSDQLQDFLNTGIPLQTREERVKYITLLLLSSDAPISLGELADLMYISRTTLENDLRYMRSLYSECPPYMGFKRYKNTLSAEPNERKHRMLLSRLFIENWESYSHIGEYIWDDLFNPDDFSCIMDITREILKKNHIKIDDYGIMDFAFSIATARMRISKGHNLTEMLNVTYIDSHLSDIASQIIDRLEPIWNMQINTVERQEISRILQVRQSFSWKISTIEDLQQFYELRFYRLVDDWLKELRDIFHFDCTVSTETYISLSVHTGALLGRMRFRYERSNPLINDFKNHYPALLEYATYFRKHFYREFQYTLNENELGFYALYLFHIIEENYQLHTTNAISAALVSHLSRSSSQFLLSQLRMRYSSLVHFAGTFSIHEKEALKKSGAQLIFSTVKNPDVLPGLPVITVDYAMSAKNYEKLSLALENIKLNTLFPQRSNLIYEALHPDLFYKDCCAKNCEELLAFLTNNLKEREWVPDDLLKGLLKREAFSSTAFYCGIALPYTTRIFCSKTTLSVALLKKPITWGRQRVQAVFLLSLKKEDVPYLNGYLSLAVRLNTDRELLNRLLATHTYEQFYKLLGQEL